MERRQHKRPLRHPGMRNRKTVLAQYQVTIKKNVQVQRARAVLNAGRAVAAKRTLHLQQRLEQRARREIGFERDRRIQKARLLGNPHRPG
jgi:hypothetical protein